MAVIKNVNPLKEKSDLIQGWLDKQILNNTNISGEFTKFRYGISYKRFTTGIMDSVLPEYPGRFSAWQTNSFYYYEIVLKNGKLFVQLACDINEQLPDAIRKVYDKVFPSLFGYKRNPERAYYCYAFGEKMPVSPETPDNAIIEYLDECFKKINGFESALIKLLTEMATA